MSKECQTLTAFELQQEAKLQQLDDLRTLFLESVDLQIALSSSPVEAHPKALDHWKELGPMSIGTVIKESDISCLNIGPNDLEFKTIEEVDEDGYEVQRMGFFKKGSDKLHGIGRQVWHGLDIQEGMWRDDRFEGYGRECWWSGGYYQGGWKDDNYHGQGIHVFADGRTEQGKFVNGELVAE